MKIPDKVKIGGVDYTIAYEKKLILSSNKAGLGCIDYDNAVIKIEPDVQCEQAKCLTLLHEIMHGIAEHFGLNINDNEDVIDKLAKGLYMVIKDNPEMFGGVPNG